MTARETLRILHVEDNVDDTKLVERSLRHGGFLPEINRVETKAAFAAALAGSTWDVILADYTLPTFSGPAALAMYRETELDVPFILVSGTIGETVAVEMMRAGAHDYLLKTSLDRLAPAIRRELRETEVRRERRVAEATLLQRDRWLRAANQALAELVRLPVFGGDDLDTAMRAVSETAARVFGVDHAVIWTFDRDRRSIVGRDLFAAPGFGRGNGRQLATADHPAFFRALDESRCVAAHDAPADFRTCELTQKYLEPMGIKSLLDATILSRGELIGVVGIEHTGPPRIWTDEEQTFAGSLADLVALVFEAAERRRAEAETRSLQEQLYQSQKLEAVGTLAGGIAHDFNNILFAILGHAELGERRLPEDHPIRHHLQQILSAGHRARDLVRQILTFSRQRPQERNPVALGGILIEAGQLLRASLPASVELRTICASNEVHFEGDASQVHQVVVNLATNAAHAMAGRGGIVEMREDIVQLDDVSARTLPPLAPGPHVRLTVRDSGHGMDEATVARIFEPFFTTKLPGEGTGLGLAVVHGIVTAHGGAIKVQSALGLGTTFELWFPASGDRVAAATIGERELPRGHGEQILYVDDQPLNAELACEMLQVLGYRAEAESFPEVALARFRAAPETFDLVVVDFRMPRMNGLDLMREIVAARKGMPVLLSTGSGIALDYTAALELGFCGLLAKPFKLQTLAEEVANSLRKK